MLSRIRFVPAHWASWQSKVMRHFTDQGVRGDQNGAANAIAADKKGTPTLQSCFRFESGQEWPDHLSNLKCWSTSAIHSARLHAGSHFPNYKYKALLSSSTCGHTTNQLPFPGSKVNATTQQSKALSDYCRTNKKIWQHYNRYLALEFKHLCSHIYKRIPATPHQPGSLTQAPCRCAS